MQANIQNCTVFTGTAERDGDCLEVMRGMDSSSIDLIYLDPPFNSKKQWDAPLGSAAAGASFKDRWTYSDIKEEWWRTIRGENRALYSVVETAGYTGGKPDKAYMCYMGVRLLEMQRILKPTGSIYLHCDPVMSHSLKLAMDAIFGAANFRNEIAWCYRTGGLSTKWFGRKHDILLFYVKNAKEKYAFNIIKEKSYLTHRYGFANVEIYEDERGHYTKISCRDHWAIDALRGNHPESVGYPTQKPMALLERIIKASSNPGDIVLDPFCGCGTALEVAEKLGRKWIGVDASQLAARIIVNNRPLLKDVKSGVAMRTDLPTRTDDKYELVPDLNDKDYLYGKQGGICLGCEISFHKRNLTIDHNIPRSKGGQDILANKQLLCGACNSAKGNRLTLDELRAVLRKRGIIR